MDPIREFAQFQGKKYAPSTRRLYVAAVKKALKRLGKKPEDYGSCEVMLAEFREKIASGELAKSLRLTPFLKFLESRIPKTEPEPDYGPVREWVLERIEAEIKATKKALYFIRRDLAMLVCLCVAPEQGSPRRWPKAALSVARTANGFEVTLWGKAVDRPGLALGLIYWHNWRDRLDRPELSRLHRKAWAFSDLLFPNSKGEVMTKHAVRNALLRLGSFTGAGVRPTPDLVRRAFLQVSA
jgi:hypothetical protein